MFFICESQSDDEYWENWNNNYPQTDILEVLSYEKYYADSVEKHPEIAPYYARFDKYRFEAEYLEKTRKLDTNVSESMNHVIKLFIGDPAQFKNIFDTEVLFKVCEEEVWMPIQTIILKSMKKEAEKGDKLTIYCLYLNEHTSKNRLFNTFFISEFTK